MILTIDEMHFLYILIGGYYNKSKELKDEEGMKLSATILTKLEIKNPDEVKNERKQKKTAKHSNSGTLSNTISTEVPENAKCIH